MTIPFAKPPRLPLDALVNKICTDLMMVFVGNGYKHIGFTLIVQELGGDEQTAASGNLKPEGIKALLEQCLEEMNKIEVPDEPARPH